MHRKEVEACIAKYVLKLQELQKREAEIIKQIRILESLIPPIVKVPKTKTVKVAITKPDGTPGEEEREEQTVEEVEQMPTHAYTDQPMPEAEHGKLVDGVCKTLDKLLKL